ncbi:MAG TPA: single-stranded-DNA-specific exonuclease RecJ [Bacteroidales bacterium]|nr:single-stranded-DNA-specific exonuclease RecJ [Bacteroidales bacterium]HNQ82074.1 single-stranded-DNA-specific exonuclease RecJ [Bacteroidales bacterium]HOX78969.1 single-stranded-DNA-specific exonuclease RecJ [Bacteroidales bacterium]HPI85724.1 single-stranded-DNA-specific exonuclease RecJ [Bacteroidales bacterium]HPM91651.1 single-stranded-DNA-specific exonuclease RecJ [Bacteroidales bacterium]
MEKRWVLKPQGNKDLVRHLSKVLNINENLANLLAQRGVASYDGAKAYFRPQLEHLHDPFLMKDMHKAVERIEKALKKGEKILVYGDYDVDGTTAVALVYTFLKKLHEKVDFYVPDRYSEGYGISFKGIDFAAENGFSLIIALDCGIKAVEKVAYATGKKVDFIICDHHRPGDSLPEAIAILDPKRDDCTYPYKELAGCGIGFKLIQAFAWKNNIAFSSLEEYLDLVVVSIASDIVPITGENRVLAYYGLKRINSRPRAGLEAILNVSNKYSKTNGEGPDRQYIRELTINDLVFIVGPRINAAGRIKSARTSVELLITKDPAEAFELGNQINKQNSDRKTLDTQATHHALEIIHSDPKFLKRRSTVLYHPEWHKGVIGIVASRLIEAYYRPTIVLTHSEGMITGSARSIKGFDIYDAVDSCGDLLEHFGGHMYAAGLSLLPENFDKFKERFEEYVSTHLTEELAVPEIEIDSKLNLQDVQRKFYDILRQFAPFGPGNMSPVFQTDNVIDAGKAKIVGNNHLKLEVFQRDVRSEPISAIAFGQGEENFEHIRDGNPFDICYHIEENEWNGRKSFQLNIKDIKWSAG